MDKIIVRKWILALMLTSALFGCSNNKSKLTKEKLKNTYVIRSKFLKISCNVLNFFELSDSTDTIEIYSDETFTPYCLPFHYWSQIDCQSGLADYDGNSSMEFTSNFYRSSYKKSISIYDLCNFINENCGKMSLIGEKDEFPFSSFNSSIGLNFTSNKTSNSFGFGVYYENMMIVNSYYVFCDDKIRDKFHKAFNLKGYYRAESGYDKVCEDFFIYY